MEIISIILGALLIIGFLVLPKEEIDKIKDPKVKIALGGAIFVRKILLPIIALILIGSGIYYFIEKRKEDLVIQEKNDRRVTLKKLVNIASTVHHEKETEILKLGFVASSPNEFGSTYSRILEDEVLEKWETGVIRYITENNSHYIRVREELKDSEYKFVRETPNNYGDMMSEYSNDTIDVTVGIFASSQRYLVAISDYRVLVEPKKIIELKELVGKWGRRNSSNSGSLEFRSNNTFIFVHTESGSIRGKWNLEGKEITLHYNAEYDKRFSYAKIPHPFSSITEIIVLQGKTGNELNGYIKGGYNNNLSLTKME